MNKTPKVVCVMCTYGRFEIVRQSLTMFIAQDYSNKELIIFNTAETPLELSDAAKHYPVKIINQHKKSDGSDYRSLGDVRSEALKHANGDLYACWDDDDLFLPWHLSQAVEKYKKSGKKAWKPDVSYWSTDGGESFHGLMGNAMEASFVVDMFHMKKYGFSCNKSGAEHVNGGWLDHIDYKQEMISPFESYGYIWGDERAPHKTSGHIDAENNFENHKNASVDFGNGKLTPAPFKIYDKFFNSILKFWRNNRTYKEKLQQEHVATDGDMDRLVSMISNFYLANMLEVPSFLHADEPTETPKKEKQNPYEENIGVVPGHGVGEGFVIEHSNGLTNGFFVEFGAVDGITHSNSYTLENYYGWRGILIEAHTESFEWLERFRPNALNLNLVISSEDQKEVDFLEFSWSNESQYNFDHSQIAKEREYFPPNQEGITTTKRISRSLYSVLEEHRAPKTIDFLVIDIESEETLDILKNLPFDEYTFKYICVEIKDALLSAEIFEHMYINGYHLGMASTAGPDYVFIKQ